MKTYDVVVIGAGASGVFCALNIEGSVLILEKQQKPMLKLLKTGNGKCNLSNLDLDIKNYNTDKIEEIIKNKNQTINFLNDIGIFHTTIEKRVYPYNFSAKAVVKTFEKKINSKNNIKLKNSEEVIKVEEIDGIFKLTTNSYSYFARKIVYAIGTEAGYDNAYENKNILARHNITEFKCSLSPIKSKDELFKNLFGLRLKARVTVFKKNSVLYSEYGEIQFKREGLTGIPILQASSYLARSKAEKIEINFLEGIDKNYFIKSEAEENTDCILDNRLLNNAKKIIKNNSAKDIFDFLSEYEIKNIEPYSKSQAQVFSGGIELDEIDFSNMKSKKYHDCYIIGEVLNVDGLCGGYNLQWAWSSALQAAIDINKELSGKRK